MSTPATSTVPIGPTTVVGYGGTVVGLIAAILSMIFPDGDEQNIALIASALFTIGSFLVTQIGRYIQARELAKRAPIAAPPVITASSGSGWSQVTRTETTHPKNPDRPSDPAVDLVGEQDLPTREEESASPAPDDDSAVPDNPDETA